MKDESERILRMAVEGWTEYCPGICLERLRKTLKDFSQDNQCPGQDPNRPPSEYKSKSFFLPDQPVQFLLCGYYIFVCIDVSVLENLLPLSSGSKWIGWRCDQVILEGWHGERSFRTTPLAHQDGEQAFLPTILDGVTTHKTIIWILTTVKISEYMFMSVVFYV